MFNLIFIFIITLQTSTAFKVKQYSQLIFKKKQLFKIFIIQIYSRKKLRATNCIYYQILKI